MERREFLKKSAVAAVGAASMVRVSEGSAESTGSRVIARRALGKTGESLSIIGMGGIVVMNADAGEAKNIVAEAVDRGINYFDVAPSYGNAQERLGPALEPYRSKSFLACKTDARDKAGALKDLDNSLKLLRTDHVDLYQFHALTKMKDLDQVLGPGGAMEAFEEAKKAGKLRYIGFSAHSVETALSALDRYNFDTILFPVNWVLYSRANFGPQVLERAQEKGTGVLALKGMAKTTWSVEQAKDHPEPKCWYQPAAYPQEASLGLRWTLGHPITAALPPGDERYFRLAMDVAQHYSPLDRAEEQSLLARTPGVTPIFHLGNSV